MESFSHIIEHLALHIGKIKVTRHIAIATLTGITTNSDNGNVVGSNLLVDDSTADRHLWQWVFT